jgi:hypothetical protein
MRDNGKLDRWALQRAGLATVFLMITCIAANAYCSEPSAPYCAEQWDAFDNEYDFDSCKSEMESYKNDVDDYLQCLRREVEEAAEEARRKGDDALSTYNDAVEAFNRRANQ